MTSDMRTTPQRCSEHTARLSGTSARLLWREAGPEIQRHINSRISGSPDTDWVAYTLHKYFGARLPLVRCLSLGCGTGHLERRLAQLNAFQHCDAYDVAEPSLLEARRLAQEEGIHNISYYAADLNTTVFSPGVYDSVWIHSAMHHFEALEHVCQQIRHSLKPGGLLLLNEYIGPSRFQFPSRQKEIANLCLGLLPAQYRILMQEQIALELDRAPFRNGTRWLVSRLADKLRDGDLIGVVRRRFHAYRARVNGQHIKRKTVRFPSRRDVTSFDRSEAVRSEEIVEVLQRDFDIIERKDWGGNVLQFLLAGIAGNFSAEDQLSQALLKMVINIEDTFLQCGEFKSDFAYIVARPKGRAI